ncbi:PSD1 and planctomycete cytochrome C domain-containing protein [Opitutaceae bacterium]|nr:PSD1 and planctomycete cytochrome C domain-containing protein [Opitutaceae bacterium]
MRASLTPQLALTSGLLAVLSIPVHAVDEIDFIEDIYPLLEANCLECHGPDEAEADFRVDSRQALLSGGGSGIPTVVAGDTFESYLVEVLREEDDEYRMPQKADPLPEHEIALIEKWIETGAEIPEDFGSVDAFGGTDLWSMQPVIRPDVPEVAKADSPIDAFLLEALQKHDLSFNPRANPRDLIKRTSVLLTGLLPAPDHIRAFEAASAVDGSGAFESLIDELMASPHFGERWAQHWLDVIRWAETNGSEANLYRKNAWMYRDYVVDSFNADKPYDQFIREQIAGDQMGVGVATGFLVAGPHVPAATVGREESAIRQARADRLDEIAQTVGASMMGVTVSCARCHNHKFDPISIKDYYSLTAVFEGIEFGGRYPEMSPNDPVFQRDQKKRQELAATRAILSDEVGAWQEDWNGWNETFFQPVETTKVKVTFLAPRASLDEVKLYGPEDAEKNLALAETGTVAESPERYTDFRGPVININDGAEGTMNWRTPKGEKFAEGDWPWVALAFPEARTVDRLAISSNRQYFLETDYLSSYSPNSPKDYRVEWLDAEGNWIEAVSTPELRDRMSEDERMAQFASDLQDAVDAVLDDGVQPSFVGQFIEPAKAHVLHRGSPESPRVEVDPAGLTVLDGDLGLDNASPDPERRVKFADWLTDTENPLTARVMVNRVWHHVFGTGIVPTPGDFGFAGALPSHPELLDWLADEFKQPQSSEALAWSVKGLIKQILLTDAFRQSSQPHDMGLAKDASAMFLWRFPPRRVEAEVIRDSILLASGKLDSRIGGKSYRIHNEKKTYAQWQVVNNAGPDTWRRLLYQERMRRVDDQNFTAFDFPDCGQVRAKRPVSTTPLQALNLMNSPFSVNQADLIAERARMDHPDDPEKATAALFSLILGRDPTADELALSSEVAANSGLNVVSRSLINTNEFAFLP